MKMVNQTDKTCSFGGEMLAYLYDELSSEGRERFETHLEGCSLCIDEFAELSEARYSVYEWKNVEFSPLATPRFVVPVENAPASSSWLDSIRAAFAWNGAVALAGGAAILVLGVFGFAMLFNSPEAPVAAVVEPPSSPVASVPLTALSPTKTTETAEADKLAIRQPKVDDVAPRRSEGATVEVRKQTESATIKPVRNSRISPVQTRRTTTSRSLDNSPTLGQFVEDRDESLRLSDLFDDLESRELD